MQKKELVKPKNTHGNRLQELFLIVWNQLRTSSDIFGIVIIALIVLIPHTLTTRELSFRLDTDYNVAIPMAEFAIQAMRDPQNYLVWNPFVGLGVPVIGDPSSLLMSPWYMPFLMIFDADLGLRTIIFLSVIVSGLSMRWLLSHIGATPMIVIWGSAIYQFSGALGAMIASGHIERFASYAVTPLVVWCMWQTGKIIKPYILLGLLFACMYLTDDFYTPWFLSIFWLSFSTYFYFSGLKNIRTIVHEIAIASGVFLVFTMPKLVFFVRDILPHFNRLSYILPYEGSIHAWLLPLIYIIPWQVEFYDRPTLQRLLHFRYNWYEYYAFISPFALVPLLYIKNVLQNLFVRLSLVAIGIGALYISVGFLYSPFHWIFELVPIARFFRVPQRIGVPLLVPLIVIISLCMNYVIQRKSRRLTILIWSVCFVSLMWTGIVFFQTAGRGFESHRSAEPYIAWKLRRMDPSPFYVANFVCCTQPYFFEHSIPVINYYYGWIPNYSPRFTNVTGDQNDFTQFKVWRPSYIISSKAESFYDYGYFPFFDTDGIQVWKTHYPNIFPAL